MLNHLWSLNWHKSMLEESFSIYIDKLSIKIKDNNQEMKFVSNTDLLKYVINEVINGEVELFKEELKDFLENLVELMEWNNAK